MSRRVYGMRSTAFQKTPLKKNNNLNSPSDNYDDDDDDGEQEFFRFKNKKEAFHRKTKSRFVYNRYKHILSLNKVGK